jgi:hypothetical protein
MIERLILLRRALQGLIVCCDADLLRVNPNYSQRDLIVINQANNREMIALLNELGGLGGVW